MPIIEAIVPLTIEKSLPDETLSDAIAATDRERALCAIPQLTTAQAYELATVRGYKGTERSFLGSFRHRNYGEKFNIEIFEKIGSQNRYRNTKNFTP